MVVMFARPVMFKLPVNVTPALVIVQSSKRPQTPLVSGTGLVQCHCGMVGKHGSVEGGKIFTTCLYMPAGHDRGAPYSQITP